MCLVDRRAPTPLLPKRPTEKEEKRMKFTKGLACVTTVVVSLAADMGLAAVTSPTVIWFSDNFDSYASGTRLRLVSPANWNGSAGSLGAPVGPENMVLNTFNYPSGAG